MRCYEKRFRALFVSLFLVLVANCSAATEISIRAPQLIQNEEGYSLSADFNINFNRRLEEAVNKGVVLFFAVDFELTRSRWYWIDEQVIHRNRTYQLSYHALTRQYRLSTGGLHQSYDSLEDALRVMSRLRNWLVLERGGLKNGQVFLAGLRMRLDLSQMAKTFQVSALSNRDWNVSSDWVEWKFTSGEDSASEPQVSSLPPSPASIPAQNQGESR